MVYISHLGTSLGV